MFFTDLKSFKSVSVVFSHTPFIEFSAEEINAFERLSIPVIPVAISGAREIVRGSDWFPHRGRISVTIRPPITPSGEGWQVALNLRNAARTEIARYCGEPDLVEGEQLEDT